jgi:hypothetical protein
VYIRDVWCGGVCSLSSVRLHTSSHQACKCSDHMYETLDPDDVVFKYITKINYLKKPSRHKTWYTLFSTFDLGNTHTHTHTHIYIFIVRWYRSGTSEYLDAKNISGIRFNFIGHSAMLAVWLCIIDYTLLLCLTEQITLWTLYDTTGWLLSKHSSPAQRFQNHSHPGNESSSETL